MAACFDRNGGAAVYVLEFFKLSGRPRSVVDVVGHHLVFFPCALDAQAGALLSGKSEVRVIIMICRSQIDQSNRSVRVSCR